MFWISAAGGAFGLFLTACWAQRSRRLAAEQRHGEFSVDGQCGGFAIGLLALFSLPGCRFGWGLERSFGLPGLRSETRAPVTIQPELDVLSVIDGDMNRARFTR